MKKYTYKRWKAIYTTFSLLEMLAFLGIILIAYWIGGFLGWALFFPIALVILLWLLYKIEQRF